MRAESEWHPAVDDIQADARRAAARERRRAGQQRRLAELAVAVNAMDRYDEVLATAADHARRLTGARRAAVTHLEEGWDESHTALSARERDSVWQDEDSVPGGPGVLDAVVGEGRTLRLGPRDFDGPGWETLHPPGRSPLTSYLAVPLIARDGAHLGLLQVSGKASGAGFNDEDESLALQVAEVIATALHRVMLLERERDARAEAEEQAKLRGLLADASKAFATSLEVDETLRTLARFTLPGLADWSCVHLLTETGRVHAARVETVSGPRAQEVRSVLHRLPVSTGQDVGPGAVIRTGRSELFRRLTRPVIEALASGDVRPEDLRVLGSSSGIVVPLRARGRTLGAHSIGRSGRPYSDSELEFVRELAARAALALDTAHRYAFEREVAVTLQRSLLPQALPPSEVVATASRYLPGASGTEIGGDWYDVVALPDGSLGLIVGDVMGRGIPAAAVMGQLRATVRAYALEGHGPAAVLRRTDVVVGSLDEGQITTCIYGVLDPATGRLTMASAGHLPPVIVPPAGDAHFAALEANVPLGVGGHDFGQASLDLAPGSTVVLYTDGLVEGRDQPADEGMTRLLAAAQGPVRSPDELCDRLLRAMGRDGDHDDDTALLVISLVPPGRRPESP